MNSIYNIWNYEYIQQEAQRRHDFEQVKKVQDTVKALHDFLDGMDEIEPRYLDYANVEICGVICNYFHKHGM